MGLTKEDADADAILSDVELATFETQLGQSHARLLEHWAMAPFEAALYDSPGCTGSSMTVNASNQERRCTECFDVCGKSFDSGDAMSVADRSMPSGVSSQVRSMRVTAGIAYVVMNYCLGAFNYGALDASGSRVMGARDECVDFADGKVVAHVAAVLPAIREVVAAQFLKQAKT
ncbi:unnamed protein product [Symbiodinium natans]|uniref:Uncharacterized protein n=1 Tax=Symbiodinium natans TaxID=878477 RepID=A0A812U1S6_9DINO|nr:unnamed protein product [Symbiodinium natans]